MIVEAISKTIQIKVGVTGSGMSGKTTFMKSLFNDFGKNIESYESTINRTILCDYCNLEIPLKSWEIKIHMVSSPGAQFYEVTRPIILSGSDGIIFIIDSQKKARQRNVKAFKELNNYYGDVLKKLPLILVFNKYDVPDKFNKQKFLDDIQIKDYYQLKVMETVATEDVGILNSFEKIIDMILKNLNVIELISALN